MSASDGDPKAAPGVTRREFLAASALGAGLAVGSARPAAARPPGTATAGCNDASHALANVDRDLLEASIAQLQRYYAQRRYTVSEVVDWYLGRI